MSYLSNHTELILQLLVLSVTMPRNKELSSVTRARIVTFAECGYRQIDIAKRLNVSQSVVSRTIKSYKINQSFTSAHRSGRPKVTTAKTDAIIRRKICIRPMLSARQLSAEIINPPSIRTIQRRLHTKFNLKARRPAKKPLLSAKNIKDRLAFCKKYRHWTPKMWQKVLFSDESRFHTLQRISSYVRRPINTRYETKYIQPTVRHSPSVMVWACFSGSGTGAIWFLTLNTTMKATEYLEVLREHLLSSMETLGCHYFQQDGAPCHKAKLVMNWLGSQNVNILDWPGQSPDLNPIENLWATIKERVAAEHPTSVTSLQAIIEQVWCSVSIEECQKLCDSMPHRIQAVIHSKGRHSKY